MNLLKTLWKKHFVRILAVYAVIAVLFVGGIVVWERFKPAWVESIEIDEWDKWIQNAGGVTVETGDYPACDWANMPGRYEGDALTNAYTAALLVENLGLMDEYWQVSEAGYSTEEEWVMLRYWFNPPWNSPYVIYDVEEILTFERETGRFIARDYYGY